MRTRAFVHSMVRAQRHVGAEFAASLGDDRNGVTLALAPEAGTACGDDFAVSIEPIDADTVLRGVVDRMARIIGEGELLEMADLYRPSARELDSIERAVVVRAVTLAGASFRSRNSELSRQRQSDCSDESFLDHVFLQGPGATGAGEVIRTSGLPARSPGRGDRASPITAARPPAPDGAPTRRRWQTPCCRRDSPQSSRRSHPAPAPRG